MALFDGLDQRLETEAQRQVAAFISSRSDEIFDFTCELIRTPSVNPPGDERAVSEIIMQRLAALGIDDRSIVAAEATRPNVMAHVTGTAAGRTLMLSGHIDTKPAGNLDEWRTDPWEPTVIGDQLIGLGSGDMKAAIAAMIYAAAAFRELGDFSGKLSLAFTADEENGSRLGSKWLAAEGYIDADVCVIGEPAGVHEEWESIHLVSRGAALFKVIVLGTQMHSSISDQLPGVNATLKMAELALKMQRELRSYLTFDDHPYCRFGPTVNVGVTAEAGVTYGVFPGRAEFATDIRTLPGMTEEQVKVDVQRFLDDAMATDLNSTRRSSGISWSVPPRSTAPTRSCNPWPVSHAPCLATRLDWTPFPALRMPHTSRPLQTFHASRRSDPESCHGRTVPTSRCTRTEPHKRR